MEAFNTIGKPKMTGSFTLNKPGPIAKRPISFICLLFMTNAIRMTTINVIPEPPRPTVNVSMKGFVMMCGKASPALKASRFSRAKVFQIGSITELTMI